MVKAARLCAESRRKVVGSRRLENSFCQPSSKWVRFFELGKDKAAKGEGWAPPIFCKHFQFLELNATNLILAQRYGCLCFMVQ